MSNYEDIYVKGYNGTTIHAVAVGPRTDTAVIFIHGLSHACGVWEKQLNSAMADRYRLLAYDLRGHGLSDRPEDGYDKSEAWAGDLAAVIEASEAKKVVLVG